MTRTTPDARRTPARARAGVRPADAVAPAAADRDAADAERAPELPARAGRRARVLDAVRDTLDFRDRLFTPTLVEVPLRRTLAEYRKRRVPVLDQQGEGACTGFGLATVANYLLRSRAATPDDVAVSPRMLYEMAKRYDEWPGERYEGSSARGAMKGWHKHGVCCDAVWPYEFGTTDRGLTARRSGDAARRPLGAYFRVNHRDLVAMHAAVAEVGVLFATAVVHDGWNAVEAGGRIPYAADTPPLGGHAFAIVGYDETGFWVQNSWGEDWGKDGYAQVGYDDWLANGTDVWVARLGAPVRLASRAAAARALPSVAAGSRGYVFEDLRPHVVSLGNDGRLRAGGTYGTSEDDVARLLADDFRDLTARWDANRPKRVVLYAHGGLVGEDAALQRTAEYRAALLGEQVYPISLVWKTDYWTTVTNILRDAVRRRRPEGVLDGAQDFMLDRLDDMLEPLARALSGRAAWAEMTENAERATTGPGGGAAFLAARLAALDARERRAGRPGLELHLVAHSAGSVLLAPLVPRLTEPAPRGHGLALETVTLWAPACTVELFDRTYRPAATAGRIGRFALYTLTDEAERADDCANVYHKSLLYLVSHAFEARERRPFRGGTALLGMERAIRADAGLRAFLESGNREWVRAPNAHHVGHDGTPTGRLDASGARRHGDFDDDRETVRSTLARILGARGGAGIPQLPPFDRTREGLRAMRQELSAGTVPR